jgi:anthranilate phosphoribosyltransferase
MLGDSPQLQHQSQSQQWTPEEIDDFLSLRMGDEETLSRLSGLTPERIDAELFQSFLTAMRSRALPLPPLDIPTLDCCGTGGSGLPRFNVSTTSAFILAAGGVPTIKFGNRASSSRGGSFDLLERLGIPAQFLLAALSDILGECGLVFLYAPQVYPDLARFSALRKSIGGQTMFNFMGPLLNPVLPAYRLLGVSHPRMQAMVAEQLRQDSHTQRAWVVRAENGLDEICPTGVTNIHDINGSFLNQLDYRSNTEASLVEEVLSYTSEENLQIFQGIVQNEDRQSSAYRASCLNAGAGLYLAGKTTTFEEGVQMADGLLAHRHVAELVEKVRKTYERFV